LRNLLANAEWARQGLSGVNASFGQSNGNAESERLKLAVTFEDQQKSIFNDSGSFDASHIQVVKNQSSLNSPTKDGSSCVPINISSFIESAGNWSCATNSQHESRLPLLEMMDDIDEDKYKSKSPSEFLSRWFRNRRARLASPSLRSEEGADYTRFVLPGVIFLLLLFTVIHFFFKYGRESAAHDASLDPAFNPNIRVQDQ
jgi:hypothetical protein